MSKLGIATMVGLTTLLSGCATITTGTTQQITFESTPSGATVRVTAGETLTTTTPGQLKLSRGRTYDVTFVKEGYFNAEHCLKQKTNAAVVGNILFGGLIGLLVDYSSGAAYWLEPGLLTTTMRPRPVEVAEDPSAQQGVSVEPPSP